MYVSPSGDFTVELLDDGTLDTVVEITCKRCGNSWEERYQPDLEESENMDRIDYVFEIAAEDADSDGCPRCDHHHVDEHGEVMSYDETYGL